VVVTLQLSLSGVDEITGSITAGDVTETATAPRDNYSKSGPVAPEEPAYTMTLTGTSTGLPGGVGYAAITVDGAGNIRAAGRLGDDTMYSFSSVVSGSGTWPFYASLYKSMGYIGGTLTFEQNGQTDLDGTLYWMRPATEGFGGYASGFAGAVAAAGYVYTPPAKDAPAIPLDGQHLGLITFSGGVLGPPIDAQVSLGPTNGLVVSGTSGVKFTLTPSTGVFTGTLNAGLAKPLPFYGVLLQSLDGGEGLFQSPTISGPVQITSP
jgi:hypothetical protein